jgi:phytol kinase
VVVFAGLWLLVGFSTGTSTLLGPVMWITHHGRAAGWSDGVESWVVRGIIVAYFVCSALISLWLARIVVDSRLAHVRYGIPALALAAAVSALWMWLTPGMAGDLEAIESSPGSSFTFGPLPDEARMAELKADGFTTVVSLLHPAVIPFEPQLIAECRESAERVGLEFVSIPMLPWVGKNVEARSRIEELARTGSGRYYVHCYLGRDRILLARRIVERAEPATEIVLESPAPTLTDGLLFERGEVIEAASGIWLTPYPTDDEMMRFILPGRYAAVVSLLDPGNPDDLPWIEREGRLLADHRIDFHLLPIPGDEIDPERAMAVAREVAGLPRPLVVHAFLAPSKGRSPSAEAFLQALRSVLPSMPPSSVFVSTADDEVRAVAPETESRVEAEARIEPRDSDVLPAPVEPSPRSFRGMVPSARTIILAGPILLLFTTLAGAFAGRLRMVRKVGAPYTRKVFHFVIFTMAGALHLAGGLPVVNLFGAIVSGAVLYAVIRGDGFAFYESMARPSDAPKRTLFILLPLLTTAVGGLASALLFGAFAYVGYLVAGWGDAIGEPVGAAFGRTRYRVPSLAGVPATRSVEGSAAVFLVGTLAALLGMLAAGVPAASAVAVALACGVGCTAVEAVSTHGLDNLTIQLTASGTAWLLLS